MNISRHRALFVGLGAVVSVALLQAFNSFACYKHNLLGFLGALLFIAIPMLPALVVLKTRNPLRAVGASLLFAPWLIVAYYTDCVLPHQGGGASMVYVVVVMFGLPCALIGAAITGPLMKALDVDVDAR